MQAIQTKFLPPTNAKGARVKAWCDAGSITLPWDHARDVQKNHENAFISLVNKLGWRGEWTSGTAERGSFGYVFCRRRDDGLNHYVFHGREA